MSKDPRWQDLKRLSERDETLSDGAQRFLSGLIDRLAKTPRQLAGDPFILSWRVVQTVTGGMVRGVCKKQAYRYIRALEESEYIFPTPKAYVRDFLVGKHSYNPAAVKYFNFKFVRLKRESKASKNAVAAKKFADETRKLIGTKKTFQPFAD